MYSLFLLACTQAALNVEDDPKHHGGADTADSGIVPDSGDTADSADPLVYDCAALPKPEDRELDGPRAHHDIVFDDLGELIGTDTQSLLASTYDGNVSVFVAGLAALEGLERLPDGDFVASDPNNTQLLRITPDGVVTTLATDLPGVYELTVGPDGNVYAGNVYRTPRPELARVDVATGEVTTWIKLPHGDVPRMLQFSLDSTVAYIATVGTGNVYSVPVGPDLMPTGDPEVFASAVGTSWQDGIGMDACGNLYVAEYASSGLYRVAPDGTVTSLVRRRVQLYGHGLEWGSGVGGWRADAVYLPQPYDSETVREVVIGVPSAVTVRTWSGP